MNGSFLLQPEANHKNTQSYVDSLCLVTVVKLQV